MEIDYKEYDKSITYIQIGESEVTKENLVKHLSHYHSHGKFEAVTKGSLSDNIGKMLSHYDIVRPWKRQDTNPGEFPSFGGGERVGWKDNGGKATELYCELTKPKHIYKVRIGGRLHETFDTRHDAVGEIALLERRNPDARVQIEIKSDREI